MPPNRSNSHFNSGVYYQQLIGGNVGIIAIEMRLRGTTDGEECNYNNFIHRDPSLFPVWMVIRGGTVVKAWLWLVGCVLVVTKEVCVLLCLLFHILDICINISGRGSSSKSAWTRLGWTLFLREHCLCGNGSGRMVAVMVSTSESSAEDLGHSHHNPHIQTDTKSSESELIHNLNAHEVLRKWVVLEQEQVPVKTVPEPNSEYDSKAVTF